MKIVDKVRSYLLDLLKSEEEDRFGDLDSIKAIKNTALREKYKGAEQYYRNDKITAIRDWYQGLGLSGIAYSYHDIAYLMRGWGYTVNEDNDEEYYKKCDMFWDILAQITYMS